MTLNDTDFDSQSGVVSGSRPKNSVKIALFRGPSSSINGGPVTCWIIFVYAPGRKLKRKDQIFEAHFSNKGNARFLHIAAFQCANAGNLMSGNYLLHDELENRYKDSKFELKHTTAGIITEANLDAAGFAVMFFGQQCTIDIKIKSRAGFLSYTLLSTSFDVDDSKGSALTPALAWAAGSGWRSGLQALLAVTNDPNTSRFDGRSALSWAAGNGQLETLEELLGKIDVDQKDNSGRTPLSWASEAGHKYVIEKLLGVEARLDYDKQHRSPIWWAARSGQKAILELLLKLEGALGSFLDVPDHDGDTPVAIAAKQDHVPVLRLLVREGLRSSTPTLSDEGRTFLTLYLNKAAEKGWINLLIVVMESNEIRDPAIEYKGPLYLAVLNGQKAVVDLLLPAGANPNPEDHEYTLLCLSIKNRHESIVKALLDAGADSQMRDTYGRSPWDYAEGNQTVLSMLAASNDEGKLTVSEIEEWKDQTHHLTDTITDGKFQATIISFDAQPDGVVFRVTEENVAKVLKDPRAAGADLSTSFRWIHLPANNMRWVELLMVRLYDGPQRAYQILKPERWVRRQHQGGMGKPHAKFMRPHRQAFASTPSGSKLLHDLVLFMPFLHWDFNCFRLRRKEALKELQDQHQVSPQFDRNLIKSLLSLKQGDKISAEQCLVIDYFQDTYRSLHLRRTLDQYYYSTLEDTESRDISQVSSRYQEKTRSSIKTMTMVDQLWLWVLQGSDGQPDTLISCFPTVGTLEHTEFERHLDGKPHPDLYKRTDVLGNIKKHLGDEPSSVRSAHDLAHVIAACCSRNYLDPSTTLDLGPERHGIQFSDIYESTIGNMMQKEATSFDNFRGLAVNEVADIKEEIACLHEIKDVLDELNIMAVLFQDQKKVLSTMNTHAAMPRHRHQKAPRLEKDQTMTTQLQSDDDSLEYAALGDMIVDEGAQGSPLVEGVDEQSSSHEPGHKLLKADPTTVAHLVSDDGDRIGPQARMTVAKSPLKDLRFEESADRTNKDIAYLPLELVSRSVEEINGMMDRAKRVQKDLNLLVDLKFKHNNVIDSRQSLDMTKRTADMTSKTVALTTQIKLSEDQSVKLAKSTAELTKRINDATEQTKLSTEETMKLAQKADKEGRTVMVFTIVTIIFLPLSFMATMFQLPIN
ncbi:hypothetical protein BDV96DRAFT_635365, partial [Lophiotrema nucula]